MGKGGYSIFVRRVGGALAAGATFVACLLVVATPAAAEGETAHGTGTFENWPHCPGGSTTTFEFAATGGAAVSGTFSFTCSATPSFPETSFGGTVSCLVVDGTAATLGGTLTHSTAPGFPVGLELSFNVFDGGPDGAGDGVGVLLTEATCRQEASYLPISSGDIIVVGGVVLPTLTVSDERRLEASGRIAFRVTLSEPSATAVTVTISTVDGTATAPSDYVSKTATVTIAPGSTVATVRVRLVDDGLAEPDESFTVLLSDAVGATITDDTGVGLIRNDDAL